MRILLTNDDGAYAPGLHALRQALEPLGEVWVVAPAHEQSGVGHSITIKAPLLVEELFDDGRPIGWAVEGSPADCVKLACLELLDPLPEVLVSGINWGSNAGINVLYSGTVAAAIEGAFFSLRSFAISLEYSPHPDFRRTAQLSARLLQALLDQGLPPGTLLNINFPDLNRGRPKGVVVVRQEVARYEEQFERRIDPRGRVYFWPTPELVLPRAARPQTDVSALAEGYITVTPLQFDLTNEHLLRQLTDLPLFESGEAWNILEG
jgi:5'-nucleotidase